MWPWSRLRKLELENWQMREALGCPIPNWVDRKYPRQLAGNAGKNPFKCGICDAREKYPDLHLKHDAARHGAMYVPSKDFVQS